MKIGSIYGVENFSLSSLPADMYVHGIIANPPCLEFSTARSSGRARNPQAGMFLVKECQRIIAEARTAGHLKWWVIENPAKGRLKDYLGAPAYQYEPWWYGSPWTKRTALWGEFNIPPREYQDWGDVPKIKGLYTRPGRQKPSLAFNHKSALKLIPEFAMLDPNDITTDMEFRSLCSQKFAWAFKRHNP